MIYSNIEINIKVSVARPQANLKFSVSDNDFLLRITD